MFCLTTTLHLKDMDDLQKLCNNSPTLENDPLFLPNLTEIIYVISVQDIDSARKLFFGTGDIDSARNLFRYRGHRLFQVNNKKGGPG